MPSNMTLRLSSVRCRNAATRKSVLTTTEAKCFLPVILYRHQVRLLFCNFSDQDWTVTNFKAAKIGVFAFTQFLALDLFISCFVYAAYQQMLRVHNFKNEWHLATVILEENEIHTTKLYAPSNGETHTRGAKDLRSMYLKATFLTQLDARRITMKFTTI